MKLCKLMFKISLNTAGMERFWVGHIQPEAGGTLRWKCLLSSWESEPGDQGKNE